MTPGGKAADELLENFGRWLVDCHMEKAILVAQNGRKFDFPMLKNAPDSTGFVDVLCVNIIAFADSLSLLKHKIPGRDTYFLGD